MGYNNEESVQDVIVFDVETAPIDDVQTYLEPVSAPSNYKDEAKIAAYVAEAQRAQADKAALDPDLARIVAIGFRVHKTVEVQIARTEDEERHSLEWFWGVCKSVRGGRLQYVGYNVLEFDLPVLFRRSLYLEVQAPYIQIDRFKHPDVEDLMQRLSFNGRQRFHSLAFYAARFGLLNEDGIAGKQIPELVKAGDWAGVEAHVRSDVNLTWQLAKRIGVFGKERMVA